ncbi:hypothetical protein TNCV_2208201 [Trichonephila clavipes]|uniref:Uncharacterized protein n=1 Tax=Trichonephila clavipes TaxID=2585209 RepID=A0A8X6VGP1_TRICX|nr:hypothetical protein TNCV_2208201 [Trichonephila clavipes]
MPMILPLSNCDSCSYCLRKRHVYLNSSFVSDSANSNKLRLSVLYSTESDVKRPPPSIHPEKSVLRTTPSGNNNSTYTPGHCVKQRLDGMYRYRCPCSFNTMPQLINRSDCRMVMSQSLGNHGRDILLVRDLVNVQATAENFSYHGRSVQCR